MTHRGRATSFTVVTGHSRHAVDSDTNWEALAQAGGTIVVLMGVAHREEIARRLVAGGLDPSTPVAAVTWGTRPQQSTVRVRLDELGTAPVEPPATIVVGAVAELDLSWYDKRPLFGRRVVVTRARTQASDLARGLESLGATVFEVPTIAFGPPSDGGVAMDAAVVGIGGYHWVAFTSANAVEATMTRLRDARALGGVRVAVVGQATAASLRSWGIAADLVPARHDAEALLEAWPGGTGRVLFPRSQTGRDVLAEGLRAKGWTVDVVDAYSTYRPEPKANDERLVANADAICFSSSSTVSGFVESFGLSALPKVVVCIGPVTAQSARAAGIDVTAVSRSASVTSMVDAVVDALSGP